jgi:hypothetical protein
MLLLGRHSYPFDVHQVIYRAQQDAYPALAICCGKPIACTDDINVCFAYA